MDAIERMADRTDERHTTPKKRRRLPSKVITLRPRPDYRQEDYIRKLLNDSELDYRGAETMLITKETFDKVLLLVGKRTGRGVSKQKQAAEALTLIYYHGKQVEEACEESGISRRAALSAFQWAIRKLGIDVTPGRITLKSLAISHKVYKYGQRYNIDLDRLLIFVV